MLDVGGLRSVGGVAHVVLVLLDVGKVGIMPEVDKILAFSKCHPTSHPCRTMSHPCRTSDALDFLKNGVENQKSESEKI